MKIIVVAMVKNEEVFIESSVRYWLSFADHVILFDHYSDDGTMAIIRCLIDEFGERLVLFNSYISIGVERLQDLVTNAMTETAFREYGADLVVPLDTDEYPYLAQGGSLREFFCTLPQETCYKVYWMPFAPPENDTIESSVFAPYAFTRKKSTCMTDWEKTIITRECYEHYKPMLIKGNHQFVNNNENPIPPRKNLSPQLFYAHYSCQGKSHYLIKNLHGWLSVYSDKTWAPGTALHYQLACEEILKKNGNISHDVLDWYALSSNGMTGESVEDIQNSIEIVDPRTIFPDIEIKYTPKYIVKKEPIISLFESALMITEQYRKSSMAEQKVTELQDSLRKKEEEWNALITSKSWKITKPLRDFMTFLHRK